jgi:fumarate hydratase subunit beta
VSEAIKVRGPLSEGDARALRAGDRVVISGPVYTARDAAHKRLVEALEAGRSIPFELEGQIIYYVGPCPAQPGQAIGSCGPTTSGRMDPYAPVLLARGLRGMIGKGSRSPEVIEAMKRHGAVYFAAIGGAGALAARTVRKSELVAYEDLGPEAILRLEVQDFPAVVCVDSEGRDLYETGKAKYRMAWK